MIIIPDIHGRSFWREAVLKKQPGEKIVFLGDYLDPYSGEIDHYTGEPITKDSALDNFKSILDLAFSSKDITLLIGNHDASYFLGCPECRQDRKNKSEISKLFKDNIGLFKLGYNLRNYNTLLVHAGITDKFLVCCSDMGKELDYNSSEGYFDCVDYLNDLLSNYNDEQSYNILSALLSNIGLDRGGYNITGSPIWADFYSIKKNREDAPKQIVGHTQYNPIVEYDPRTDKEKIVFGIGETGACLDCRTAFRFYEDEWKFEPITDVYNLKLY